MGRETFDQAIKRITREAIEASLAEIELALSDWLGEAASATDWWKPDPEDPYWMLESNEGGWLKNQHSMLTTRDPVKALRYPSEWHADVARRNLSGNGFLHFKPTEHLWCQKEPRP